MIAVRSNEPELTDKEDKDRNYEKSIQTRSKKGKRRLAKF